MTPEELAAIRARAGRRTFSYRDVLALIGALEEAQAQLQAARESLLIETRVAQGQTKRARKAEDDARTLAAVVLMTENHFAGSGSCAFCFREWDDDSEKVQHYPGCPWPAAVEVAKLYQSGDKRKEDPIGTE